MPAELISGSNTNVGLVRGNNEDCFLSRPDIGLWLVADGMGGHEAGEVASNLAKDYIEKAVSKGHNLQESISQSHFAVQQAAANNIGSPNMGTTIVALRLHGIQYEVAWVGDSRAYLWDNGTLTQISTDHSYVQELLACGAIKPEEVATHAQRNIITQSIGVSTLDTVRVDVVSGILQEGQKIILCSDGLSDLVPDEQIAEILGKTYEDSQALADRLVARALDNGGWDNVTVQVITTPATSGLAGRTQKALLKSPLKPLVVNARDKKQQYFLLGLGVLALIALLLLS